MQARSYFIQAATRDLAGVMRVEPFSSPRVAETALSQPGAPEGLSQKQLETLAGRVVETVLDLAAQGASGDDIAAAVRRAAKRELATRPQLERAYLARFSAQMPRLLDLPRLFELSQAGLAAGPGQAAAFTGQSHIVGGASPAFARALEDLEMVAGTGLSVLFTGESGTGKELMARRLHELSPRSAGPFVAVNCAALPGELLESELFGHQRGAFSGASQAKRGYIRAAQGGSLFLDEIAESSPQFQVRLLRVLEERVVTPVGSHQGEPVDFRLVSASHRDLVQAAKEGSFNQALLHRIMVVPIELPPLRKRGEDLDRLLDHFWELACQTAGRQVALSPETRAALRAYQWPGNLREMKNLLQRLAALARGASIEPQDLPPEIVKGRSDLRLKAIQVRLEKAASIPAKRVPELARILERHQGGVLTNQDIRRQLACSDGTAKNLLRSLVQAGLLTASGQKGGRRYQVIGNFKED